MSSFLHAVLNGLREEKKYVLLFLLVVCTYLLIFSPVAEESAREDEMVALKKAEAKLELRVQDEVYLEQVWAEKPWIPVLLMAATVVVLFLICFGLFLNFRWFMLWKQKKPVWGSGGPGAAVQPWRLRDLFKVTTLIMAMSMMLAMITHFVAAWFFHLEDSSYFMMIDTLGVDLAAAACVLWFIRFEYRQRWDEIGLKIRNWAKDLGAGFTTYCGILPFFLFMLFVMITVASFFHYEPPPHPLVRVFVSEPEASGGAFMALSILLACIIGPVVEELFFRGFCYPIFRKKWGKGFALVLSSTFFAIIHESGFAFLPVFCLGLALAYLFEKRGSLIPSMMLHVLHNSLFLGYFFLIKLLFLDV